MTKRYIKQLMMAGFVLAAILLIALVTIEVTKSEELKPPPPNIIFILADDMGWNDVSYHGSPQIPTPNIDALAASGIVLRRYYASPQCTPSRAALLTGIYPVRLGLQNFVISAGAPYGLPLKFRILPQYLKNLGYTTHGIGKWHLGYHRKIYTPSHRGFDTYFGYWNGAIDYYDYTSYDIVRGSQGKKVMYGIDLHNNTETVKNVRGQYATDLFTDKAVEIIENHNNSKPLFLYFSHLACHTGNSYMRMQAPPETESTFKYIKDEDRRSYAGVVKKLDESVGKVFLSLRKKGLLDNTILVFSSDNGGEPEGSRGGHASNWPLRGMKLHLFEGGVRVPALIWSPLFKLKEPRVVNQLVHISDWLPTFYSAAGGTVSDLEDIDGIDMWNHLLNGTPLPRNELLLNLNSVDSTAGIINGNLKLLTGDYSDGNDGWYGPSGLEDMETGFPRSMDSWVWPENCSSTIKTALERNGMWINNDTETWRLKLKVNCEFNASSAKDKNYECKPKVEPCLFDLEKDPCEYENIAHLNPDIVESLMEKLEKYNRTGVPPIIKNVDPNADPRCHGFAYVSWLDQEYASDCSQSIVKNCT